MKKLMLAFCFLFGGLVAVNAQDTTSTSQQQYPTSTQQDDQDRERINSRDLPDAVKRSLETQEYRGWLVNTVYKTTGVNQSQSDSASVSGNQNQNDSTSVSGDTSGAYAQEVFVVELKNGAQTKTVRFDKDGKKLDDPGLNNDQK